MLMRFPSWHILQPCSARIRTGSRRNRSAHCGNEACRSTSPGPAGAPRECDPSPVFAAFSEATQCLPSRASRRLLGSSSSPWLAALREHDALDWRRVPFAPLMSALALSHVSPEDAQKLLPEPDEPLGLGAEPAFFIQFMTVPSPPGRAALALAVPAPRAKAVGVARIAAEESPQTRALAATASLLETTARRRKLRLVVRIRHLVRFLHLSHMLTLVMPQVKTCVRAWPGRACTRSRAAR